MWDEFVIGAGGNRSEMRERFLAETPCPDWSSPGLDPRRPTLGLGGRDLGISASGCTDSVQDCSVISWLVPMSPSVWLD